MKKISFGAIFLILLMAGAQPASAYCIPPCSEGGGSSGSSPQSDQSIKEALAPEIVNSDSSLTDSQALSKTTLVGKTPSGTSRPSSETVVSDINSLLEEPKQPPASSPKSPSHTVGGISKILGNMGGGVGKNMGGGGFNNNPDGS